ncbi:DMT family transporter [Aquabacterium sp. OR-4]|uniref:DMT family transporter n=1 Tax=Aquabacterium sp. OR-4 TaxID=2978127 RepID=UPI0028C6DC92|nr:EamA family transporter [Aquabacterium sp. OR-4]MDT7838652.1 EamA family transporter [Aquabacterium sp. OR-4]
MYPIARPWLGVACVCGAAMLWGTTGTAQALAGAQLPALWFGALRLAFAAAFYAMLALATGAWRASAWRGLSPAAALGAGLCMAVYNLAFFAGVRLTGVAVGTAIALGSGPLWAGLLQAAVQRQPPAAHWWLGAALAVAGGVLLASGGPLLAAGAAATLPISLPGIALCLVSGLAYAVYSLLNQRMLRQAPAAVITLSAFGVAALLALPAAVWQAGLPAPDARALAATAYTGVVTAGLAYLLYSHALHHVSLATGVTLALTEPVVAFVLAVALLGEPVGGPALAGLALVLAGVLGVVRAELRRGIAAPA